MGDRWLGAEPTIDRLAVFRNNVAAVSDPGVGDDSADGWRVGSIWVNTATPAAFICESDTVGAANWLNVSATSGGDFDFGLNAALRGLTPY